MPFSIFIRRNSPFKIFHPTYVREKLGKRTYSLVIYVDSAASEPRVNGISVTVLKLKLRGL